MNLQRRFRIFSIVIFTLFLWGGCNIYQSSGRKSFEGKIPEAQQNQSSSAENLQDDVDLENETCWVQPSDEALWRSDFQSHAHIQFIDETLMQVCVSER